MKENLKCSCEYCLRMGPSFKKIRDALPEDLKPEFEYMVTRLMTVEEDLNYAEAQLDGSWPGWEWITEAKKAAGYK